MKCLILAGGRGERLWPLSRKNYPKQFIQVQKNHSLFQETVARNLPYCDEFIIVTNYEYKDIVLNQMEVFRGVPFRCVFEGKARKTTAAITLACMELQPSEFVFVVAADHIIAMNECEHGYKESLLKAKEKAANGKIVLFGKEVDEIDGRFGYITDHRLIEKPNSELIDEIKNLDLLQNIGLIVFQNGIFLNEIKAIDSLIWEQCRDAFENRTVIPEGTLYPASVLETINPVAIEKSVLEKTEKTECIKIGFAWDDVGSLEDIEKTELSADGIGIVNESNNSVIVNQSPHQAVLVNGLDDVLVVNTEDAIYIGKQGKSYLLKQILHNNSELESFSEKGRISYNSWGFYEHLSEGENYRVRRVVIRSGKTIYEHKHEECTENWSIIEGKARVVLNGEIKDYLKNDNIEIKACVSHQISNIGDKPLILIETAVGKVFDGGEGLFETGEKITELDLGLKIDSLVKLSPAFMDYLWGGTKLREVYGKKCDFDVIAESWELSAHPAANCIVASGRHQGLSFSRYLETVGKEVLGWKCAPLQSFPLLIKLIDAKQDLSIQVHPDDEYALVNENEYGKNEMWYVIDSEPGAGLYVGFKKDVQEKEVEQYLQDNRITELLNFYPTKQGDVFFIPAGTVHAIGKGNFICEIQQSSNITYRLYDYGRVDKFGNPRELHVRKALDVLDYRKYIPNKIENNNGKIRCKYFEIQHIDVVERKEFILEGDSFYSIVCISGMGILELNEEYSIKAGETVFIPATNDTLNIIGKMSLLIARI